MIIFTFFEEIGVVFILSNIAGRLLEDLHYSPDPNDPNDPQ